jgi:2',3'-cyclic-nucleotide 2'-phosphodiesterase/3'-nucleotidase
MKKHSLFIAFLLSLCLLLSSCSNTLDSLGSCDVTGKHKDENFDDRCDRCDVSVAAVIDFYTINDLHGKFDDSSANIGVDELTTYLEGSDQRDDHAIFLSSGDMWQGSSESNLTQGNIITDWMNALEFSAMTLGNHEYDWGEEAIRKNLEISNFPFLAINVYDRVTNKRADYATPSVIIEEGGVKIGVIGAIGDCYSSIAGDKTEDVYFKVGDELTRLVKAESERLKDEGADFIVYCLHDGNDKSNSGAVNSIELSSYYDISLSDGFVDLVFEGHTHKNYVQLDSYGVYHLQGGGDNRGITHAEVSINTANGTHLVRESDYIGDAVYKYMDDSPKVDEILSKYSEEIAKGNRLLGFNGYYRNSDYLADLMAKLYTEWGQSQYGDRYNIVLGGGYIKLRSPYNLNAGHIKYSDVHTIFPFDNVMTLCSVSGYYLKQNFINTENESYRVFYTEYGESIKNKIEDGKTYYIIVDSYTSGYSKNRLTVVERFKEGFYARDLLAKYVEDGNLKNQ